MALLEPLYKVSEICSTFGVDTAVVCPGSRSAALTLAFTRTSKIHTHVITDERSAAFVALGMAQISKKPVVLICTSGTAGLNFAPAVAEAFFQNIPLLILTADRPPEWINQHDGQTIFQQNLFGNHIIKSYDFPVDYSHPDSVWQTERITNEALALTKTGPVHINIPIREPFYPKEGETFTGEHRLVTYFSTEQTLSENVWENLTETWNNSSEIVIAVGQNHDNLDESLQALSKLSNVTILSDVISNVNIDKKISSHDTFLPKLHESSVDLLITLGKSFISKAFKQHFRKNKPKVHWHVEEQIELIDPLQSITHKIPVSAKYFLDELSKKTKTEKNTSHDWQSSETKAKDYLQEFISKVEYGELKAIHTILQTLKKGEILHVGNSMPVRYTNLLGAFLPKNITVYANRGTSGIDGIISTAIGQALKSDKKTHCLVGDVSFFYDSNALFAAKPKNLNIYLLNNGGGNIFRMIDGPKAQPELESHFITNTGRKAKYLAIEAGYKYHEIRSQDDLETAINNKEDDAVLFEIFLDGVHDSEIFKSLKAGFTL
jgi:2-succinyl-5-enolpyruvyl-6-hydroxy-3-cyclohexene-1-carboxylate synthase